MLKLLRKGPVCAGIPADGSTCDARVDHPGARCLSCLEELSTSRDVEARLEAAGRAELPLELFQLLAGDPDDRVRLRIARHTECPLIVLQHLEADGDAAVRLAAAAALSTSLSPRVLRQPEQDEALFTRAEVEALGRTDHDGEGQSTASVVADRIRRVGGPGAIEPTAERHASPPFADGPAEGSRPARWRRRHRRAPRGRCRARRDEGRAADRPPCRRRADRPR